MKWGEYINKNWNKIRIYYLLSIIISFILLAISYYLFKESSYITIIFLIIFGFLSSFWFILFKSKPNMSVLESAVGESTYKKHKKAIWIVYIIIGVILLFFLFLVMFST